MWTAAKCRRKIARIEAPGACVPGAAQHERLLKRVYARLRRAMARSGALQTRDRKERGVSGGPGSAAQHSRAQASVRSLRKVQRALAPAPHPGHLAPAFAPPAAPMYHRRTPTIVKPRRTPGRGAMKAAVMHKFRG